MCEFARDQLLKWMQIKMTDFCDREVCCSVASIPRSLRGGWQSLRVFILHELLSQSSITNPCPNISQTFIIFWVHPGWTHSLHFVLQPCNNCSDCLQSTCSRHLLIFSSLWKRNHSYLHVLFLVFLPIVFLVKIKKYNFEFKIQVLHFSGFDWHYQQYFQKELWFLVSTNDCTC